MRGECDSSAKGCDLSKCADATFRGRDWKISSRSMRQHSPLGGRGARRCVSLVVIRLSFRRPGLRFIIREFSPLGKGKNPLTGEDAYLLRCSHTAPPEIDDNTRCLSSFSWRSGPRTLRMDALFQFLLLKIWFRMGVNSHPHIPTARHVHHPSVLSGPPIGRKLGFPQSRGEVGGGGDEAKVCDAAMERKYALLPR